MPSFRPRIRPSRRAAYPLGLVGLLVGAVAVVIAPAPWNLMTGLVSAGLGLFAATWMLDRSFAADIERAMAAVGEVKVRLAQLGMRIEAVSQRVDQQPMAAADAAPARVAIAELTAEVGILGGIVKDVANMLADHEDRLNEPPPAPPVAVAPPPAPPPRPVETHAAPQNPPSPSPVSLAAAAPAPSQPRRIEPQLAPEMLVEAPAALQSRQLEEDAARGEAIAAAIAASGVEVHLQPVVQLPHRRTIGYEALARLKLADGTLLLPAEFLGTVEARGLAATLDALMLTRVIAIARHLASRGGEQFVSCNISPSTWAEPRAVASIARLLDNYREHVSTLVLEMPQRTYRTLEPASLGMLGAMSAIGVRFSLDQVADLRLDPASLSDRGVRFVKIGAALMMAAAEQRLKLEIAADDLAPLLARSGIRLIGERVETDRMAADLLELNVAQAQGLLFGAPRAARPEIFAEPPREEPVAQPEPEPAPAPEQERVPFRSILRRATA